MVFLLEELKIGAIDVGTTKIKAGIYSAYGNLIEFAELGSPVIHKGPIAEHNPKRLILSIKETIRYFSKKGVKCLGITTYRGSLAIWNRNDNHALSNIITWMDLRSSIRYKKLPFSIKLFSKVPKIGPILSPESLIIRLLALTRERNDLVDLIYNNSICIWNVDAFIVSNLINKCYTDATIGTLTGIYHPKNFNDMWRLLSFLGLKRFNVPEIIDHEKVLGLMEEGIKLGGIMGDQQAASLGSNCIEEGCLKITVGSGLFLDLSLGSNFRLMTGQGLLPIVLYKVSSNVNWGVEAYVPGIGTFIDSILELFDVNYEVMEKVLDVKDPIFVLPTLYGLRFPKMSKGLTFLPVDYYGLSHRRVLSSVLHSIALLTRFYYKIITEKAGRPKKIVVTGGLSRSKTLAKLIASYIERPILRTKDPHMSLRGVARLAQRACYSEDSFSEPEMEILEPNEDLKILSDNSIIKAVKLIKNMQI